jgi:hypothetical protein
MGPSLAKILTKASSVFFIEILIFKFSLIFFSFFLKKSRSLPYRHLYRYCSFEPGDEN